MAPNFMLAARRLSRAALMTLAFAGAAGVAGVAWAPGVARGAAASWPTSTPSAPSEDDPVGALIGELVFHADLLIALDRLCPRGPATDWHGALARPVQQAYSPQLRELSRRLGAKAGAQLVRQRGGCQTPGFAAAYDESRAEYRELQQRWRALGE
jgi:hypothetical protein